MSEIKTNIGSGLDGDYRKDLNGNFTIIKAIEGKHTSDIKDNSEKISTLTEKQNDDAKKIILLLKNLEQIVAALQKFEVPIEWDGENIVIREDV